MTLVFRQWKMKPVRILLLLHILALVLGASGCSVQSEEGDQANEILLLEFRFEDSDASAVELVWGVDGWNVMPTALLPADTEIRQNLMYTAMYWQEGTQLSEGFWLAQLKIPLGARVEFGFMSSVLDQSGSQTQVWRAVDETMFPTVLQNGAVSARVIHVLDQEYTEANYLPTLNVTQMIAYHMPTAGEVELVWGVNGWAPLPASMHPPKTRVQNNLMYTVMQIEGELFTAKLELPSGSKLNYGFLVTKKRNGAPISMWQQVPKEQHPILIEDGAIEVAGTLSLTDAVESNREFTAGPDFLLGASALAALLFALANWFAKWRTVATGWKRSLIAVLATGASLYFYFLVLRAHIIGFEWISWRFSWRYLADVLFAGYYDLLFAGGMTILGAAFILAFRKYKTICWILHWSFSLTALFLIALTFANLQFLQATGANFNYEWFYYADLLNSPEAATTLTSGVTNSMLLNLLTTGAALLATAYALFLLIQLLPTLRARKPYLAMMIAPLCIYFPLAQQQLRVAHWQEEKVANPILSFAGSLLQAWNSPSLFSMELSPDAPRFQVVKENILADSPIQFLPTDSGKLAGPVQNVLLVVLESVAAEYVEPFDSHYAVTPEINRYRDRAAIFKNFYAHAPASNKSLVSIQGSIYPWISYRSLTNERPTVSMPTLSSELKAAGYRTAFLSASDIKFGRGDEFLARRGYDEIAGYESLDCTRTHYQSEWSYLAGVDEMCLADVFANWIAQEPDDPFFVMMWTSATHYPYFLVDETQEVDYGVQDETLNRYLNALHRTDQAVGALLHHLEARNLLESTLVVLVGDHGEAFGRHDQITHASHIYEENIHVPLMLINPALFQGDVYETMGGHVDLAPTIMHILGQPAPDRWQGQSLFSTKRSGRTYFFSVWSDYLFGYREADEKFIFNATKSSYELYDLSSDPYEATNLAESRPQALQEGREILAAWIQYHDGYMQSLLANREPQPVTKATTP